MTTTYYADSQSRDQYRYYVNGSVETFKFIGYDEDWTKESYKGDFLHGTPYVFRRHRDVRTHGTIEVDNATAPTDTLRYSGVLDGFRPFNPKVGNSDNAAYNKAVDKLMSRLDNANFSVSIIEAGQTRQLLSAMNHWDRFMKFYFALHGEKYFRNVSRVLAEHWLEYTYAWRPLLSDIFAACNAKMGDQFVRLIGNGRDTDVFEDEWVGSNITYRRITTERTGYRLEVTLGDSGNAFSGFASLDPLVIGWESLPASFVVDWFVDIAGYLRNRELALVSNTRFQTGMVTKSVRRDTEYRAISSTLGRVNGSGWARTLEIQRNVLGEMPLPRLPTWQPSLSWRRLLSAAALLRVVFLSKY